jgi:hypothetical protein
MVLLADFQLNIMALIGHNPTPLVFGSEPESVTWL